MATPTPNWKSFQVQIPGQDLLEQVRNVLETLVTFLEILKAILDTVKVFLVDFGNPIKALVEALIKLILLLFDSLRQTGIYALYDIPDPFTDPNFNKNVGGFQAFVTRWKGSLTDTRDPNRPQPISGVTKSGFILVVVDAESADGLVRLVTLLLRFFGKEFINPRYSAPSNVKVLPFGSTGDPITSIVKVFTDHPKGILIEWALPQSTPTGDPGASDLFGIAASEFIPPKFLIEKSASNPNVEILDSDLNNASATGRVTSIVKTNFEAGGQPGKVISRKVRLSDEFNDPFIKFQKYIDIDAKTNTATFITGQLGTFRYLDSDVLPNTTYYYRVRAYSGPLKISGTSVSFDPPKTNVVDKTAFVQWPSTDPGNRPVMGRASAILRLKFPSVPATFDVIENLKRIFQAGFSFNFHLPIPKGDQFNGQGLPANPQTPITDVGKGSLVDYAGPLAAFTSVPILGSAAAKTSVGQFQTNFVPDPVTGQLPEMPWQTFLVKANATRLASIVAGAMLENGSADAFRGLMEGTPPHTTSVHNLPTSSLSAQLFALTAVDSSGNVSRDTVALYGDAFADANTRLNILAAVNFVKGFTLGGTPPDWIQISILRDIIPWSGQFLYDLIAKIQGLVDAYKGALDEIKNFIDLIERKINTLESFIEYLVSILDFIESLQFGFFVLFAPEVEGDVTTWMQLVDSAGGSKPPSGPGGYTGGVSFAYVAADVTAFAAALKLIF